MILKTTHLTVAYHHGYLRYIKWGNEELVRMIYTAVRDQHWLTANMNISEEKIVKDEQAFKITYQAKYILNAIEYFASVEIIGKPDDTISFHFIGTANCDFLRNRIGICVHNPILECVGQSVEIIQGDGTSLISVFPQLIAPHQPFKNIKQLIWKTPKQVQARLAFEGDIFETEDQRNWTDNSFKTYSTPLDIPFPVLIKKGDCVEQKVVLTVTDANAIEAVSNDEPAEEIRVPFPAIGYAKSSDTLSMKQVELLNQIIFHHYRVEIRFDTDWENIFDNAIEEAGLLHTKIELVVFFDDYKNEYSQLKKVLNATVASIIILQNNAVVPDQHLLDFIIPIIKADFPFIKIGAGTDVFFAELNRNRITDERLDFVSFSINPQVHLNDDETLIENLAAQQYCIQTIQSFTKLPIHVSPVTLKPRGFPGLSIDARQHTDFIANWTALTLKYLSGAAQITFYETIGEKGIINTNGLSPVYELLKKITAFKPKFIISHRVTNPLEKDALVLENESGEREIFEIDFFI
ncbi:hypothetical protein BH10BAC3_BH10BAC3_16260 [soil metagenome]